jgi:TolB-like protein
MMTQAGSISKRFIFLWSLFLFTFPYLAAQILPRVAVLPFNAIEVAESEAQIMTGVFEAAMVKTESYSVIEQNRLEQILEAQAYTLQGCTDESCAVEIGQLLAAEQIVLGEISRVGDSYMAVARIIDVEEGKNLRADRVQADSIEAMAEQVEILAFKLAGLTVSVAEEVKIAKKFGELFVYTEPDGADVYINGVRKGVSPDVFSHVPVGTVTVEARKQNRSATKEVEVGEEMAEVTLILKATFGNLFIRSSVKDLRVYLSGVSLGVFDKGLFKDLPAGRHSLELVSDSRYWMEEIEIIEGVTTRVEAYPYAIGRIRYSLPDGCAAVIQNRDYQSMIQKSGVLDPIKVGEYSVVVSGDAYKLFETTIVVSEGEQVVFAPALEYTDEYIKTVGERERVHFEWQLLQYERIISSDFVVAQEDLQAVVDVLACIRESEFDFVDLEQRAETLVFEFEHALTRQEKEQEVKTRIDVLNVQREKLSTRSERLNTIHRTANITAGVFGALSGGFLVGTITPVILFYAKYQPELATEPNVLEEKRQTIVKTFAGCTTGVMISTVLALLTGIFPKAMNDDPDEIEAQIDKLDVEIAKLRVEVSE